MNILNIIASQIKAALDTQIEAALICDLNTNQILLANKKACQNLGFTTSEICNSHLDIIFPKNFKPIQFDKNEKNSKELRQFLKKTGDSFIALTKNKILSIKNKNYQIISFKSLSNLAELSESDKNHDKEHIKFSEKLFTISQKITNVDEDMFYKNMVYGLADAFKVRWAMICLLSSGGKEAKILSLWDQTKFQNKIINLTSKNKPFTKRELQVLDHVLSGLASNSIAKQLSVTLPTIKFHLKNIYNKLDVNGRNGLLKAISNLG